MNNEKQALQEVLRFFNRDAVSVPKELYETVAKAVHEGEGVHDCRIPRQEEGFSARIPRGEAKGCFVAQPKENPALVTGLLKGIVATMSENWHTIEALKEKIQGLGYWEEPGPIMEEMKEARERISKELQSERTATASVVDLISTQARLQRTATFQLLEHLNFLF